MAFHYMFRMHLSPYLYLFICLHLGMLFGCSRLSTPDLLTPFNNPVHLNELVYAADEEPAVIVPPLHTAVQQNDLASVARLYELPDIDVNAHDQFGFSPLYYAAEGNSEHVIDYLALFPGFDINVRDRGDGVTALHVASEDGHTSFILALALIPELDANARDRHNATALHYAASNGQVEAVQALVSIPGLDLKATDSNGYTALQLAIAENHTQVIQILTALPDIDLRVRTNAS